MSRFEQIDDYLSGRLETGERIAFEQALESDPQLKAEVGFQEGIIAGVQKARAAELKAMLSKVPIPPAGGTAAVTAGKIAAIVVTAGIVGSAIYFGMKDEESQPVDEPKQEIVKQPAQEDESKALAEEREAETEPSVTETEPVKDERATTPKKKDKPKATAPVRPKIEVTDPTEDMVVDNSEPEATKQFTKESVTVSSIEVETNHSDRKHEFHYQFNAGKLILYGPFDEKLYEIIEINGEKLSIFLYYNQNYHLLDKGSMEITPLAPITDRALIDKLNEYRNN
ncbi:MAG: anti-sigma factor [Cyclobacteriaceae bacterium]